ncbi:MAG: hypothetical protein LC649_10695 [Bacteroidales bacterium]|nr:hypothetical protein [Bacteroidales bacterium]
MKKALLYSIVVILMVSCGNQKRDRDILPVVPEGAEAVSVSGEPLYSVQPSTSVKERHSIAREAWEADMTDADNLIWYGRWAAYAGEYREAIRIFTMGIERFPDDARIYRHRGHRYITIREFERAVKDFEIAAAMTSGKEDEVEPDGMPNALNIPVSTLQSNIYYHLGLARYLLGDTESALNAWDSDMALAVNDDMTVATLHWIYMALRELGRDTDAAARLEVITADMNVIENQAYYKLCLFYKGEITQDELTGDEHSDIMNDAMLYGLGNWYQYSGDPQKAEEYFNKIIDAGAWASFGYISAEMKLASK